MAEIMIQQNPIRKKAIQWIIFAQMVYSDDGVGYDTLDFLLTAIMDAGEDITDVVSEEIYEELINHVEEYDNVCIYSCMILLDNLQRVSWGVRYGG